MENKSLNLKIPNKIPNKIIIRYWVSKTLDYPDLMEFEYSPNTILHLTIEATKKGNQIMFQLIGDILYAYIDNKRFRQR